jgi:hypothetical protein
MISRTFTVHHGEGEELECYKGFNKTFDEKVPYIAIVRYEGEIETWALDDTGPAFGQLVTYYENQPGDFLMLGSFVNQRMLR